MFFSFSQLGKLRLEFVGWLIAPIRGNGLSKIQPIQTLRGIAVILVVFGHWGLVFESGYVGVDVFFVISGYVVTLVSLRIAQSNEFKVSSFLQARFLRLFPALAAMVFAVVLFQMIYYPKFEWSRAAEEGLWSILWLSNVFSHVRLGDYFGETAGTSLLLHTWSLSVEFQVYVVLAILYFWAVAKNKSIRNLRLALSILILASLIVMLSSQFDLTNNVWQAVSSYYSPITRFYQIGAGALLATFATSTTMSKQRFLFFGGLVVIAVGLIPVRLVSWNLTGLAATMGATAFILFVNSRLLMTMVEKVLAKIGDYSYSIYLWHWPILVIIQSVVTSYLEQFVLGAVLTTVLSFLSYRFVELPFMSKNARVLVGSPKVIPVFIFATACVLSLGVASQALAEITPTNFDSTKGVLEGDVTQAGFAKSLDKIVRPCQGATTSNSENIGAVFDCYETSSSDQIEILLIGNSHAAHLIPGIVSLQPTVKLRYLSFSGGFESDNSNLQKALDFWIASGSKADKLFINSFWEIEVTDTEEILRAIIASQVSPKNTVIFDDVPNFKISPARCKYSVLFPVPAPCHERLPNFTEHLESFRILINTRFPQVNLIQSSDFFLMDGGDYAFASGSSVYYRDQNHLNEIGSVSLFYYLYKSKTVY